MRAISWSILLLAASCGTAVLAQDADEPGDPNPRLAPNTVRSARERMSVIGVEPWSIPGDLDGLDGRTNGRRYEDFRVPRPGGQRLRISVTSPLIDPMVQVFAPGGT